MLGERRKCSTTGDTKFTSAKLFLRAMKSSIVWTRGPLFTSAGIKLIVGLISAYSLAQALEDFNSSKTFRNLPV